MDKIFVGGKGGMQVTNDGATILKSIMVDNAAAKVLVGTTPFVIHLILFIRSNLIVVQTCQRYRMTRLGMARQV